MKKLFTCLVMVMAALSLLAQTPGKMSYQAVVRNTEGVLLVNRNVGVRIQVLQSSEFGAAIYVETHTRSTNANGLLTLEIGGGNVVLGSFPDINWNNGPYFLKTEIYPGGGTSYSITGTSQLLTLPYALHANTAETITGNITETDPVFNAWDKSTGISIKESQISDLGNYLTTENQNLDNVLTKGNSAGNRRITDLADPVNARDAATKAYVDALLVKIEVLDLLTTGFTDTRDGSHYKVVRISNQIWMAENLRYLPTVVKSDSGSAITPCYYVYDYNSYRMRNVEEAKATVNYSTYGVLYNWPAAMAGSTSSSANPSGVKGVCPTGWHLPSDAEWTQLTDYLGGSGIAGGKLKETGTLHWTNSNTSTTNETGFTALPGGYRYYYRGEFFGIGTQSFWWSATENDPLDAWYRPAL